MKFILEYSKFKDKNINESKKNDINAALNDIKRFNRGDYKKFKNGDIEELASDIIKNLGYKPTGGSVDDVTDHLGLSIDDNDKIPVDKDLISEIYAIIE